MKQSPISVALACISCSLLLITLAFAFPPFQIGVESGPLHPVAQAEGASVIPPNHNQFMNANYFYSDLAAGGFNYDRVPFREKHLFHAANKDLAYDQLNDVFDGLGIEMVSIPSTVNVPNNEADWPLIWAWVSNNSDKFNVGEDEYFPVPNINGTNFFPNGLGAALGDPPQNGYQGVNPCWGTDNENGNFIIGAPGATTFANARLWLVPHGPFCLAVGGEDTYTIWIYMNLQNQAIGDGKVCTLMIDSDNDGDADKEVSVFNNEFELNAWKWVEFDLGGFIVNNNHRFALEWNGVNDHGELYVAKIAFESKMHSQLFTNGGHTPVGAHFDALKDNCLESQANYARFYGHMMLEPELFGSRTVSDLYKAINGENGMVRVEDVRYAYRGMGAQWPTRPKMSDQQTLMEAWIDSTDIMEMWFDQYCIWGFFGPDQKAPANDDWDAWWNAEQRDDDANPNDFINWWHWEKSVDGVDFDDTNRDLGGASIQRALNYLTKGEGGFPFNDDATFNTGTIACYETAKLAASAKHVKVHLGVQSTGMYSWNKTTNEYYMRGPVEPTPRMISVQAYIALTYKPDGIFYSYYGPRYFDPEPENPNDAEAYVAEPVIKNDRTRGMNGAPISGLTRVEPAGNNGSYWLNGSFQLNGADGFTSSVAVNGNASLATTDKYEAAKDVNEYIRGIENIYSRLRWIDSECSYDNPQIGRIEIEDTKNNNDVSDGDDLYVQVGLFSNNYFMLVNRRCESTETRKIYVRIHNVNLAVENMVYVYNPARGDVSNFAIDPLPSDLTFYTTLEPGEGKLYQIVNGINQISGTISTPVEFRGNCLIDDEVTVTSTGSLKILPNSSITFTGYGKLTVDGKLEILGKDDTSGDSLIQVSALNSSVTTVVELKGNQTDKFEYTRFVGLPQGPKSDKSSTASLIVNHCWFENCETQGLYIQKGNVTIDESEFIGNGQDGLYLYNVLATITGSKFLKNEYNGIYAYSINANSTIEESVFGGNGILGNTWPDAGIRFYNCAPLLKKSTIVANREYGLYGANGSYPVLVDLLGTAANTISANGSHETYWDQSYPYIDEGYNNFYVSDDTVIYVTSTTSLTVLNAENNHWGGGSADNPGVDGSDTYEGPGVFDATPYQSDAQTSLRGEVDNDSKSGGHGFGGIADNNRDAVEAFKEVLALEGEQPERAIAAYRDIIRNFSESAYAPMAVDRLLWLVRNNTPRNQHDQEVDRVGRYFESLVDTAESRALVWKARRAALWALAAQHRYDEAIRGFEAIIAENESLTDSVYAVIDAGTLHLEAQEWARHDSLDRVQAIGFGTNRELCPASFPDHRKKTDELLSLLNGERGERRGLIPTEYFLNQNYPNPFNSVTSITYGLPEAAKISLKIYDVTGREVASLVQGQQRAGFHKVAWQGVNQSGLPVSSGMYFIRMEAGQFVKTQKMTLVK